MRTLDLSVSLLILSFTSAGCVGAIDSENQDEPVEAAEAELTFTPPATVVKLGKPTPAPADGFDIRADRIVYVAYQSSLTGGNYKAVEVSASLQALRQSPWFATPQAGPVINLGTDGTRVLFGDGTRSIALDLSGAGATTLDPAGVFGKNTRHGQGAVIFRDATGVRVMNADGYAVGLGATVATSPGAQPRAAAVLSEGQRAYVTPNGATLRLVRLPTSAPASLAALCPLSGALSYDTASPLASAHDQVQGNARIAARLSDGRLVECLATPTASKAKIHALPFQIADVAFDGGGGIGFDGGGGIDFEGGGGIDSCSAFDGGGGINFDGGGATGIGIWAASKQTAQLAHVAANGTVRVISLSQDEPGTPAYAGAIPRHVRSLSDGSAIVSTTDGQFLHVSL